MPASKTIAAVVLAAGQSKRMGRPKMALPWGDTTVIGKVVHTLQQAGLSEIVVVVGGARQEVEGALAGLPVRITTNPLYAQGEMLSTLQAGLAALGPETETALITLGDQPQVEAAVVELIITTYTETKPALVVPSYQKRRGHPWLVARSLWPDLLALRPPQTLRDFLQQYAENIHYVLVDTASILADLDTPEDYQSSKPG